jgi:hypothetical protein
MARSLGSAAIPRDRGESAQGGEQSHHADEDDKDADDHHDDRVT